MNRLEELEQAKIIYQYGDWITAIELLTGNPVRIRHRQ